jgi:hypothetical protein
MKNEINKLFERASKFDIDDKVKQFVSKEYKVTSSYDKIYVLKKMYSVIYCLKSENNLPMDIEPEFFEIIKEAFRFYIFYILQMHSNFFIENSYSLIFYACKHLCSLIKEKPESTETNKNSLEIDIKNRLSTMKKIFLADSSKFVRDKTIISGHESTLNIFLIFLLTDLNNINEGYKKLEKIVDYPSQFGSTLTLNLESCDECVSGYKIEILFNKEVIVPFFCENPQKCDLLEFLEYSYSVIKTKLDQMK